MPSQHEPTFRVLCEWLRAANLYAKVLTQLGKLVPGGAVGMSEARAARASALEVLERMRRIASQAAIDRIAADCAGLGRLRERLKADAKLTVLRRTEYPRHPDQARTAAIDTLRRAPDAIGKLAQTRFESDERSQMRREAELHKVLQDLAKAGEQMAVLAAGGTGFVLPQSEAAMLQPLVRDGRRLEGIAKRCAQARTVDDGALAEALQRLAQEAAQAGLDATLAEQCERACASLLSLSAAERALQQAWGVSLYAWQRREALGVDPRLGFIYCLSTRFRDAASQSRYDAWLAAHETDVGEDDAGGKRVLRAVVAMCCTLYRWGLEHRQPESVSKLLATAFVHEGDRLFRPPPEWADVLDPNKGIRLRSFYDLAGGLAKDPQSLPRLGAYRLAMLDGADLRRVASAAAEVLARAEHTWAVALASKLGFFEGAVRNQAEPRGHGLGVLGSQLMERIRRITQHVRGGAAGRSVIEGNAARVFAQGDGADSYSSTPYGATRRDSWMYGARFEGVVLDACELAGSNGRNELDLFCRALASHEIPAWRIWQMLLHLRDRADRFRAALWQPMMTDAARAEEFGIYFGEEQRA